LAAVDNIAVDHGSRHAASTVELTFSNNLCLQHPLLSADLLSEIFGYTCNPLIADINRRRHAAWSDRC